MNKILVASPHRGLGDALCGLCCLRALRRLEPENEFALATKYPEITPTWARAITVPATYRRNIHANGMEYRRELDLWHRDIMKWWPEWETRDCYIFLRDFRRENPRFKWPPLPIFYQRHLNIEPAPVDFEDVLELTKEDRARALALTGPEPFALLMSGPQISAPWSWPAAKRIPAARILAGTGLRVFGLAGKDGAPIPGTTPLFVPSVRTAAAILDHARIYVGGDTGTSWIARMASRVPMVVVGRHEMRRCGQFNLFGERRVIDVYDNNPGDLEPAIVEMLARSKP